MPYEYKTFSHVYRLPFADTAIDDLAKEVTDDGWEIVSAWTEAGWAYILGRRPKEPQT